MINEPNNSKFKIVTTGTIIILVLVLALVLIISSENNDGNLSNDDITNPPSSGQTDNATPTTIDGSSSNNPSTGNNDGDSTANQGEVGSTMDVGSFRVLSIDYKPSKIVDSVYEHPTITINYEIIGDENIRVKSVKYTGCSEQAVDRLLMPGDRLEYSENCVFDFPVSIPTFLSFSYTHQFSSNRNGAAIGLEYNWTS